MTDSILMFIGFMLVLLVFIGPMLGLELSLLRQAIYELIRKMK